MASASTRKRTPIQPAAGSLPPRMKVLYITTLHRTGGWLAEAFASDSASEILLHEAIGVTSGLARLREEMFDAVLVSHEPQALDAVELVEALRGGGTEEPVVVLGGESEEELAPLCFEVGADAYCCIHRTTTRCLIWTVARAIERFQILRENRRLLQAERQRLELEHHEAERLLTQQRSLICQLESMRDGVEPERGAADSKPAVSLDDASKLSVDSLPPRLVAHYREMLRAYVIMGAGNLSDEMATLASLLASAGITARQTMQLHLNVLEELIRGLGNRSARHVMNRADLLVLEVMVHLAEGYRSFYLDLVHPARQLTLPGFDSSAAAKVA